MTDRRAFGSTYRLQLNGFGFDAATELVPSLRDLGVETVYLSPVTRARDGSSHGYDVADPTMVDPALGGQAGLDRLLAAAAGHGLTVLLDIVPNHMTASTDNPYLLDVLTHGVGSAYAGYFDVAWDEQDGKITLPVLDGSLDDLIADGSVRVLTDAGGAPVLGVGDLRYPLDPTTGRQPGADLASLLDQQHYRLINWRDANAVVNYRRFFDINELIGVRQEDPTVFATTHRLIVELVADPRVAGVRVDHVDGLRDPAGYLQNLRTAIGPEPVIEVEKILEAGEPLPAWPIDGTSGYEFAATVTGLFIDPAGARELAKAAARATGDSRDFHARGIDGKRLVAATRFPHLIEQITSSLAGLLPAHAQADIAAALTELAVQLGVYRLYRTAGEPIGEVDQRELLAAAAKARGELSTQSAAALGAIVQLFGGATTGAAEQAIGAWQQLTPPLMAKGIEDTAIYDPGQLLAGADVGTDPDKPAMTVADWHAAMSERQRSWPLAMSTLSTHDSKRSQDVRCRLAVLSEIPERWSTTITAVDRAIPSGDPAVGPDPAERRFLYETLVGSWPLNGNVDAEFVDRIQQHLLKAGREAKRRSDWITPDLDHEQAVSQFVADLLKSADYAAARDLIAGQVAEVEIAGATNSLAAVVLRAVAPGVPDIYQGDDRWFYRLVDPDNRGRLDGPAVAAMLDRLPGVMPVAAEVKELLDGWRDGRLKQFVARQSLTARRRLGEFIRIASYRPLEVLGAANEHVVAFARETAGHAIVCVVPRLVRSMDTATVSGWPVCRSVWGDTAIDIAAGDGEWANLITGQQLGQSNGRLAVSDALSAIPVALLERTG